MDEKISLSQGEEGHALYNLNSSPKASEEFSHGKEQLPDVVPDHVSRVVGLHGAKSGRANHRVTEGTAGQRAVMSGEIEVAHMPRAVRPHQK